MSREKAKILIKKYNQGIMSTEEEGLLERYIEEGLIDIEELDDLRHINQNLSVVLDQQPEIRIHQQFKAMLREEQTRSEQVAAPNWWESVFSHSLGIRWAYSMGLVLFGLALGWIIHNNNNSNEQLAVLSGELTEMREMMMLNMLEKESTSDRLMAVNLTRDMSDINEKVTDALLQTLNQDKNVNVRLATLEALYPYANHPQVRMGLIQSIHFQEDPIVQMALAEMMVALQEKRSVNALRELLDKEDLPEEAKTKIKESVDVLL